MGIVTTHQSNDDDETMDGWSVSTDDVEYVAFLRRPGHVLVTWPSKLNAGGAVALFEELAGKAEAVYAKGKANLSYDEPGDVPDWAAIAKVEDLRFLRADIGHGEILIWRVPTEENLHVPRLQIIEPKITGHDLMPLIEDTAEGNVVELIVEHFGTDDFDIEPLNAVG